MGRWLINHAYMTLPRSTMTYRHLKFLKWKLFSLARVWFRESVKCDQLHFRLDKASATNTSRRGAMESAFHDRSKEGSCRLRSPSAFQAVSLLQLMLNPASLHLFEITKAIAVARAVRRADSSPTESVIPSIINGDRIKQDHGCVRTARANLFRGAYRTRGATQRSSSWGTFVSVRTLLAGSRDVLGFENPIRPGGGDRTPVEDDDDWNHRQRAEHQRGARGGSPEPSPPPRLVLRGSARWWPASARNNHVVSWLCMCAMHARG